MIRITQMAATNPLKVSVIVWPRIMIFFNDSSASSQYPSVGFAINRHRVPILPGRLCPMSGDVQLQDTGLCINRSIFLTPTLTLTR